MPSVIVTSLRKPVSTRCRRFGRRFQPDDVDAMEITLASLILRGLKAVKALSQGRRDALMLVAAMPTPAPVPQNRSPRSRSPSVISRQSLQVAST